MISVNDLRQNVVFSHAGKVYQVQSFNRHKMGRGKAIVNLKVRDVENSGARDLTFKSGDRVEEIEINYRPLMFVYYNERTAQAVFSDPQTQQRIEIAHELIGDRQLGYLTEGVEISGQFGPGEDSGRLYAVSLPMKVELRVVETPPNEKGNTAAGGTKPARLETGITVQVPFFINPQDTILVNTETGEYAGRV